MGTLQVHTFTCNMIFLLPHITYSMLYNSYIGTKTAQSQQITSFQLESNNLHNLLNKIQIGVYYRYTLSFLAVIGALSL